MVYTLICHLYTLPDAASIAKVKSKLIEAARIYRKDKETVGWAVMQDVHDPRKFSIVERFAQESSQQYHLSNPYWKTFDPYVVPLLVRPIEVLRHEELVGEEEEEEEEEEEKEEEGKEQ
ncbi:hypothetical protein MMC19_005835 [Ptychographa xylographoides]|nr:hypothetical protein [Ptychographa xylographoides]